MRAQAAEHRGQRLALIEEVNAWAADNRTAKDDDWKGFARILREFGERWRASGHLNEKAFAELQPQWKQAWQNAAAPLEEIQRASEQRRLAMIEEAKQLGAAPMLRIDAVKSLQQRWQAEAQRVPLDRRHEQKQWDAFRKPIDDAFSRKTAEREQAASAMGEHDRTVLQASKALEAANASGDAQAIKSAMAALDAALRGQADEAARAENAAKPGAAAPAATHPAESKESAPKASDARVEKPSDATENVATAATEPAGSARRHRPTAACPRMPTTATPPPTPRLAATKPRAMWQPTAPRLRLPSRPSQRPSPWSRCVVTTDRACANPSPRQRLAAAVSSAIGAMAAGAAAARPARVDLVAGATDGMTGVVTAAAASGTDPITPIAAHALAMSRSVPSATRSNKRRTRSRNWPRKHTVRR